MATARRKRRAPPSRPLIRNHILGALLAAEYGNLLPTLEHVTLRRGQVIYRADQEIEEVYFPEAAVVAMLDQTGDGRTVEVGIIGREGIVGINVFLGGVRTPDKAIVQLSGGAMRMKSRDLRKALHYGSPLQRLLLGYARTFLAVISQSIACSQHHNIDERLARCLLTINDYAGAREFLLTHESIATLLGVRRAGITVAARKLQMAALIRYHRGRISVIDRRGLERKSCECYRFIRKQYDLLHGAPCG